MTAPAPPDPALEPTATAEIAALLAGLLAAGTAVAATAAARRALLATYEASRILQVLAGLGIARDVAVAVLTLTVTRSPLPATGRVAPASAPARRQVQLVNLQRRAAYLVAAARRVQADTEQRERDTAPTGPTGPTGTPPRRGDPAGLVDPGRRPLPDVGPPPDTVFEPERRRKARRDALEQERRHFDAHARAAAARNLVSRDVDELAAVHGDQLTWKAIMDAKTSPYCAAANGRQFLASRVPPLGFPGTVHPSCRCSAAAPVRGRARWVYDVDPRLDQH